MICVPIIEPRIDLAVKLANSVDSDLVELRLDYLKSFENLEKLGEINKPKIVTCMPQWESGHFKGSETERINVLLRAMDFCDWVSIELKTPEELMKKILQKSKRNEVKVIISYHNFESTPSRDEILEILKKEADFGADIAKVAFMPQDYEDVLNLLHVLVKNDLEIPIIALSMGELGKISRVISLILGSYLTFASAELGKESAPGQLTIGEVKKVIDILK